MAKSKPDVEPIPTRFATVSEAAEFWDTHDLSDYWDQTSAVKGEIQLARRAYLFALAPDLAERLAALAMRQGLTTETLINLWLSEKLRDQAA